MIQGRILISELITCFALACFTIKSSSIQASNDLYYLSASKGGLAPNASGQEVYSLRGGTFDYEFTAQQNKTLQVGSSTLISLTGAYKWHGCEDCFWDLFASLGAGLSNAGPITEILWGIQIPLLPIWLPTKPLRFVPQVRLDTSTRLIFSSVRPSLWSQPLCLGVTIPF